jgi:hypothetical protein
VSTVPSITATRTPLASAHRIRGGRADAPHAGRHQIAGDHRRQRRRTHRAVGHHGRDGLVATQAGGCLRESGAAKPFTASSKRCRARKPCARSRRLVAAPGSRTESS